MTLERPIISVFDGGGKFVDWLRAPVSARVTPRWLEAGDAEIVVQPGDYRADVLRQPGARVQVSLRGEHVIGGPVTAWETSGPRDPRWTFHVTDDSAVIDRLECLPDPGKALDQQPPEPVTRTGRLESVLKQLVSANAPTQGIPIDVVADAGRGPNVSLAARWQPLSDVVLPSMRAARLGLSVVWRPETNRLLLDVVTPRTYPIQLSVESRTITTYKVSQAAPTVTRVYLGPANGTVYQAVSNTQAETQWGPFLRGATFRPSANTDEASTAGTEALNDGAAKSGLSVSLAETDYIHYGGPDGLHVGDMASLLIGDVQITDVVREVVIEWSRDKALTVTPAVGAWDNSPVFALTTAVQRIAASLRRTQTRR